LCRTASSTNGASKNWNLSQQQYEFARLNYDLHHDEQAQAFGQLVERKSGEWLGRPRMPTISGMRRRGYPAESLREFCEKIGVAKRDNLIDISLRSFVCADQLNKSAQRRMVVFDPLKVVITNYEEGKFD